MEKTHCGTFMTVEKEAMEKKMKAAVANIMYPAYRMTGMQKRMLASSQQQNAVLRTRAAIFNFCSFFTTMALHINTTSNCKLLFIVLPEGCRGVSSGVSVLEDESTCAADGEFLSNVEDGVG